MLRLSLLLERTEGLDWDNIHSRRETDEVAKGEKVRRE